METYAPAAVLINRKHECLYSLGPTDRYLRVAPGQPTHDLLAMARQDMRTKLRSAIQQASQENARIVVAGGQINHDGVDVSFSIDVQPVPSEGEELLLICFVDEPKHEQKRGRPATAARRSADRRARAGTRSHENGTAGCHPQPGDFRRRAEGDQRRSVVRQ